MTGVWDWQMRELKDKYARDGWRIWESHGQVVAERDGERIAVSSPLVLEAQLEDARWQALMGRHRQSW